MILIRGERINSLTASGNVAILHDATYQTVVVDNGVRSIQDLGSTNQHKYRGISRASLIYLHAARTNDTQIFEDDADLFVLEASLISLL